MADLRSRIRNLIRQEMRLTSAAGLVTELLPSSPVDKIFLCIAVEDAFDLAFYDAEFIKCRTISDVCDLVDRRLVIIA